MTETYLGCPIFIWEALLDVGSLLAASLLIDFATTLYLKRKDESSKGPRRQRRLSLILQRT